MQPFGGLGQIGANMLMWASKNERIVIDAGILFPLEDCFDINYLIPDYSSLDAPSDLIITHGHEDHLGAVIHALERFPEMNVWAPAFAAGILRKKFSYEKIKHRIQVYDDKKVWFTEEWEIHPIHVNHSIPQTFGILLIDKAKRFCAFHVSDFKCNESDSYEKAIDFKKIQLLSQGIEKRFFFADSTSVTSKAEKTPDESSLIPSFEKIITEAEGRVFFTLFSSNIERIQNILDVALKDDRKVVPFGRSMNFYMEIAHELGLLRDFKLAFKDPDSVKKDTKNIVVLVSGCQGDFKSTLRRVAWAEDGIFKLVPSDTFVFSSKAIPGNEKKLALVINKLYEQGCRVITPDQMPLHVSGHAGREDVRRLAEVFKPTHFIPIHGESAFLHEHAAWMREKFSNTICEVLYNFHYLSLTDDLRVFITAQEAPKPIIIHGNNIPIESEAIAERRKVAAAGMIFVSVRLDSIKNTKVKIEADLFGLPLAYANKEKCVTLVQDYLKTHKIRDQEKYSDDLRVYLRRYYEVLLGYRPVVLIHFV